MTERLVINTTLFTTAYINACLELFNMAGFYVDTEYDGEDGDVAIYPMGENTWTMSWILENMKVIFD